MKSAPNKMQSSSGSISIPLGLQKWVVGGLVGAEIVQMGSITAMIAMNPDSYSRDDVSVGVSTLLLQLIAFALAFFASPKYATTINRWFVAILKTAVFVAIFGAIQLLKYYASTKWLMPVASEYIFQVVCLVGFGYALYGGRRK